MSNHLFDALFGSNAHRETCFLMTSQIGNARDELTYMQFMKKAAQISHVLVQNDVAPGDRVLVQVPKSVEMLALYAATVQTGAVFLPLNTGYTLDELTYFIEDAAPGLVICRDDVSDAVVPIAKGVGAHVLTLNADGSGSLPTSAMEQPTSFETVPRGPDDLAALLYTSGTTGRSKGAMLTHDNLLSNAEVLLREWRISDQDILIHALPIFHTHGLFVAMNTALLAGAKVNFMPSFDLDAIIAALPRSTMMMGVPTFYSRLLADRHLTPDCVAGMRLFVSGSAPLLAETHDKFFERTGHRILERYGMTETNMNTSNPYEGDRRAGTVGLPLDGVDIRLADPVSGAMVDEGQIGIIEVRGRNVFKGYWNMPEKTDEEMRDDGFFITGDLGQFDAQGYLSIVGRQKDMIITGGYNVYPKEIEDVLNSLEGIVETAVFGVPDADFGEAIVAAIVVEPAAQVDKAGLQAQVSAKLARFKHPRSYQFMAELPRNTMGKVQKTLLRDCYQD